MPITNKRRDALIAAACVAATGVVLAAVFFPLLFNEWRSYDDEGMFLVSLRELLRHGSLYTDVWADKYGPFYYLLMSSTYRALHMQPTLENGRWIVLVLTAASAAFLGGAVWRVTKNLPCTLLCELAAFVILVQGAGNEPMHPGALGVLLAAVVAFELAGYAMHRTNVHLFVVGAAAGALVMTKLNAGLLILIAIVVAFLVGNATVPRWIRVTVAALAAIAPVALVFQNLSSEAIAELAFIVAATVIGTLVVMTIDPMTVPPWSLVSIAAGAAAIIVVSLLFPLTTGTPLSSVLTGVFIRPLDQAAQLTTQPHVAVNWFVFLLTLAGIGAAATLSSRSRDSIRSWAPWINATLAGLGLWLLGVGATLAARGNPTAEWLPALALLPAIAFCSDAPEPVRFALRSFVLLATFQILVAYPVAGTQVLWGTVLMTVPCAIAIAVGIERLPVWRDASRDARLVATVLLGVVLVVASSQWPVGIWNDYLQRPSLGLPATGLMRVDPTQRDEITEVAKTLRSECDAFYGVPLENSFYLFADIRPLTGMVADRPLGLTRSQQAQVIAALRRKQSANERVCILRDHAFGPQTVPQQLRLALRKYSTIVATIGTYTISKAG